MSFNIIRIFPKNSRVFINMIFFSYIIFKEIYTINYLRMSPTFEQFSFLFAFEFFPCLMLWWLVYNISPTLDYLLSVDSQTPWSNDNTVNIITLNQWLKFASSAWLFSQVSILENLLFFSFSQWIIVFRGRGLRRKRIFTYSSECTALPELASSICQSAQKPWW